MLDMGEKSGKSLVTRKKWTEVSDGETNSTGFLHNHEELPYIELGIVPVIR